MATNKDKEEPRIQPPQQKKAQQEIERLRRIYEAREQRPPEGAVSVSPESEREEQEEPEYGPEQLEEETQEERKQPGRQTEYDRLKKERETEQKHQEELNREQAEARRASEAGESAEGAEAISGGAEAAQGAAAAREAVAAGEAAAAGVATAEGAAAGAAATGGAATGLVPVLVVIGVILLVIVIIFLLIIITLEVVCFQAGVSGWAVRTVADWTGLLPQTVCEALGSAPATSGQPGVQSQNCTQQQLQAYSQEFNTPLTSREDGLTTALKLCINGAINVRGSIFTYDTRYPTCNVTRGQPLCSPSCSHSVNSCHYGGATGANGALAIDYGLNGLGAAYAREIINAANTCSQSLSIPVKSVRCEAGSSGIVDCSSPSADHVHITLGACDRN